MHTVEKGILLLAIGHPYYGRMAYNLAVTIKAAEDIPIAIVRSSGSLSHLNPQQLKVFDCFIDLPANVPGSFASKLHINELSPFKVTLFLDADMLWLPGRKPSDLFKEFGSAEFSAITEGWYDGSDKNVNEKYPFWADLEEIKSVYALHNKRIYQWRSEVVYFCKSEKIDRLFKDARAVLSDSKLATVHTFGSHLPDELGFNIAAALNDIHPHKVKWTPAFWEVRHGRIPAPGQNEWYLASFGSNTYSGSIMKYYDSIIKPALSKLGRQHVFRLMSKKSFLPERAKF